MRKTTLRLPMIKTFDSKNHQGRRWRRSFKLNLSKPAMWGIARDYLNGSYKQHAKEVIWSGALCKLIGREPPPRRD